jgi:hypothetical protein
MFKYVGFMRLEGLKVMNRVLCAGKSETQIPLCELTRMLLFEDDDDAEEFVTHCGLEVSFSLVRFISSCSMLQVTASLVDTTDCPKQVVLNGKNLVDQLPRKKSSKPNQLSSEPELPHVRLMYCHIEEKVAGFTRADICQGHASDAVIFEDLELTTSQDPDDLLAEEETDVVATEEEDTSVESRVSKTPQPRPPNQQTTTEPSSLPTLKRGPSSQSQHAESPRHSSVVGSLLAMKKSGKPLTRYSKSLRS